MERFCGGSLRTWPNPFAARPVLGPVLGPALPSKHAYKHTVHLLKACCVTRWPFLSSKQIGHPHPGQLPLQAIMFNCGTLHIPGLGATSIHRAFKPSSQEDTVASDAPGEAPVAFTNIWSH